MEYKTRDKNFKELDTTVKLNESVWGVPMNKDLVAQAVYVYRMNERQKGTASAKTRGEVRGGGRKPWRQKGTGRARHGSIRSPLWVGGGVTFPPSERNWSKRLNKKMKLGALASVLSERLRNENIYFVNSDELTRDAFVDGSYVVVTSSDDTVKRLRNLANVELVNEKELNALSALRGKVLCIDIAVIETLENRFNGKSS